VGVIRAHGPRVALVSAGLAQKPDLPRQASVFFFSSSSTTHNHLNTPHMTSTTMAVF